MDEDFPKLGTEVVVGVRKTPHWLHMADWVLPGLKVLSGGFRHRVNRGRERRV